MPKKASISRKTVNNKSASTSGKTAIKYSPVDRYSDTLPAPVSKKRQFFQIERKGVSKSVFSIVNDWKQDTDIEDVVESMKEKYKYNPILSLTLNANDNIEINYNVINTLLYYINELENKVDQKSKIYIKLKDILKDVNDEFKVYILRVTLNNISILYDQIKKFPMADQYLQPKEKIVLYRGWSNISLKFKNIKINDQIITPAFLSTSIIENIALTFSGNIVWKIKIPKRKLSIFNYVFLGSGIKNIASFKDIGEEEFLLNIGAKLQCKAINTYIKKDYFDNFFDHEMKRMNYKKVQKDYTEYVFEFIGWDEYAIKKIEKYTPEQILNNFLKK